MDMDSSQINLNNYASGVPPFNEDSFLDAVQKVTEIDDVALQSATLLLGNNSVLISNQPVVQMAGTANQTPTTTVVLVTENGDNNNQIDQGDQQILTDPSKWAISNDIAIDKFDQEWIHRFCFVEREQKPFCLICHTSLACMKLDDIREHFHKIHHDFDRDFPINTSARNDEVKRRCEVIQSPSANIGTEYTNFSTDQSLFESVCDDMDEIEAEQAIIPIKSSKRPRVILELDEEEELADMDEEEEEDDASDSGTLIEQALRENDDISQSLTDGNSMIIPESFLSTSFSEHSQSVVNIPSTRYRNQTKTTNATNSQSDSGAGTSSLAKKPRDWRKVTRKFHHRWTDQYLVVESISNDKPICLLCYKTISAMKVHNIKRHYLQLHSQQFDSNYPPGSIGRKTRLATLIDDFRAHQKSGDAFISVLATPDLWDMDAESVEEMDDCDDSASLQSMSNHQQQNHGLFGHKTNNSQLHYNQNNNRQHPNRNLPHPFNHAHHRQCQELISSGLTVNKMERAFEHLDKFLAIIEKNDPIVQRSNKVRNAVEVAIDSYKHFFKDMKVIKQHTPADRS